MWPGACYFEISLDRPYRYNPLHNDLEAYALGYSIASLRNNLFGRGREAVLATGLHEPDQIHHPPARGRLRLSEALRCARMRINRDKLEMKIWTASDCPDPGYVFVPEPNTSQGANS